MINRTLTGYSADPTVRGYSAMYLITQYARSVRETIGTDSTDPKGCIAGRHVSTCCNTHAS